MYWPYLCRMLKYIGCTWQVIQQVALQPDTSSAHLLNPMTVYFVRYFYLFNDVHYFLDFLFLITSLADLPHHLDSSEAACYYLICWTCQSHHQSPKKHGVKLRLLANHLQYAMCSMRIHASFSQKPQSGKNLLSCTVVSCAPFAERRTR